MAIARPLANGVDWKNYRKLLIMIAASPDSSSIQEVQKILDFVIKHFASDSDCIFQDIDDESAENSYKVTIVAVK